MGNENYRDDLYDERRYRDDRYQEGRSRAAGPIRHARDAAVSSLRHARDHAFESVSDTVYATSSFVGTHAVPLTLLGLGLGMLAASVNRQRSDSAPITLSNRRTDVYGEAPRGSIGASSGTSAISHAADSIAHTAGGIAHATGELADAARERVGALAGRAAQGLDQAASQVRQTAQAARGGVNDALHGLREQASQVGHRAYEIGHDLSDRASELSQQAYQQLQRAQDRTVQFSEENPLAVGALAVAAGVTVGLLLPATRSENRLIGESRDRLFHEAQRAASRIGAGVQSSASELKGALLEQGSQQT